MKEEFQKAILDTLGAKEAAGNEADRARRERQKREQDFLEAFYLKQDQIIRPAMQEIANLLQTRGYKCPIDATPQVVHKSGEFSGLYITLSFLKGEDRATGATPLFRVEGDKVMQEVYFRERRPGSEAELVGKAKLQDLTQDLIQEKITESIKRIFKS